MWKLCNIIDNIKWKKYNLILIFIFFFIYMFIEFYFFYFVFKVVKIIKIEVKSKCINVCELYFLYCD